MCVLQSLPEWQMVTAHSLNFQYWDNLLPLILQLSVIVTKDQAGFTDRGRPIPTKFSALFLYQLRLRSLVFLVK